VISEYITPINSRLAKRQIERQTGDWQRDGKETDRKIGRQGSRQIDRKTDCRSNRMADWPTDRQEGRMAHRQTGK